jgi:hypothetical protein
MTIRGYFQTKGTMEIFQGRGRPTHNGAAIGPHLAM